MKNKIIKDIIMIFVIFIISLLLVTFISGESEFILYGIKGMNVFKRIFVVLLTLAVYSFYKINQI